LFGAVSGESLFEGVIQKYFDGEHDEETLRRLRAHGPAGGN
jgi:uncharacterized protein (DUF1810 family)